MFAFEILLGVIILLGGAWLFQTWWFIVFGVCLLVFGILFTKAKKWYWKTVFALLAILSIVVVGMFNPRYPVPVEPVAPAAAASCPTLAPVAECPAVAPAPACPAVTACDPYAVPFKDMGELNPNVETVMAGPAIYEWWLGGTLEGVQRIEAGYTVTIHGAMGHWWTLPDQAGLDCAWKLHVSNYAAKPQHANKTIAQLIISPPVDLIK